MEGFLIATLRASRAYIFYWPMVVITVCLLVRPFVIVSKMDNLLSFVDLNLIMFVSKVHSVNVCCHCSLNEMIR